MSTRVCHTYNTMKSFRNQPVRGTVLPAALVASALIGLLTLTGLYILPNMSASTAMTIAPATLTTLVDTTFTIQIVVTSATAVNAFAGRLSFDPDILTVTHIDYNTSIADLWAEEPWYNDGAGTVSFAGGSTHPGGFTGSDTLVTITFTAINSGDANVRLDQIQILQHDGLGTEAAASDTIDSVFTITPTAETELPPVEKTAVSVISPTTPLDLNNDTKITIADMSIFMLYLTTNDIRADFNSDGKVGTADLSILLNAR